MGEPPSSSGACRRWWGAVRGAWVLWPRGSQHKAGAASSLQASQSRPAGGAPRQPTSQRSVSEVWLVPSTLGGPQGPGGTADVLPSPSGLHRLRPASFSARTRNLQEGGQAGGRQDQHTLLQGCRSMMQSLEQPAHPKHTRAPTPGPSLVEDAAAQALHRALPLRCTRHVAEAAAVVHLHLTSGRWQPC